VIELFRWNAHEGSIILRGGDRFVLKIEVERYNASHIIGSCNITDKDPSDSQVEKTWYIFKSKYIASS
jgi:RimJ/RimL family protein N-acetyltransferase